MKNKKLLSLVLVLVLILGATPYFIGKKAQENIEAQAVKMSQVPGYAITLKDYDRGWFTSRATLTYGFDDHTLTILKGSDPEGDADDEEMDAATFEVLKQGLVFDITIAHGPVTFQNGINFAFLTLSGNLRDINHENYIAFKEESGITSLIDLFASVSYGGTTHITMDSPSFKATFPTKTGEELTLDFSGLTIDGTINANLDKYEASAQLDKFSLTSDTGGLIFNTMISHATGTKINDHIWAGKGMSSLSDFNFSAPEDVSLSLNNFTSEYEFDKESETALTFQGIFKLASLTVEDIDLKDFQLGFALNNLNLEALTDYVKSVTDLYQAPGEDKSSPEQTAAKIQVIATRTGENLIKGSPEFIINSFNFIMNDGFFESDGKLAINGDDLTNLLQLSDPVALNKRLTASANITFDKALAKAITTIAIKKQMAAGGVDIASMPAEQLDQMIEIQTSTALQAFIAQGYFIQDEEKYISHFDMRDGQRLINGKPLAIPGL